MRLNELRESFFETFVEKCLERVPILEITERRIIDGAYGQLRHTISHNIFTAFDAKLSRHMSAVMGQGLSAVSVVTKFAPSMELSGEHPLPTTHYASLPHALRKISEEALDGGSNASLEIKEIPSAADAIQSRTIGTEDLVGLTEALKVAEWFGQAEFVPISGDFDMIMLNPPGMKETVIADLYKGTVTVPAGADRFEAPLFGFGSHVKDHPSLRAVLASVRHAQMELKEEAIMEFRAAAEDRILRFDRALNGNKLEQHRMHAAVALIARLRVGLGDDLSGLAEDAQITALDWASVIDNEDAHTRTEPTVVVRELRDNAKMRA
ncbi:MAG: hypothetical protein AAGH74_01775 [Pseudomonadota bacterium]